MHDPIISTRTPQEISTDAQAELDGWIDERVDALVRSGMDAAAARRQAVREFGDIGTAQRYAVDQDKRADRRIRAVLWLVEFAADMRIAARSLRRSPSITAVILLTFALGVGLMTAVFSAVHATLLRALPYGDSRAFVRLPSTSNGTVSGPAQLSIASMLALRERTTSFTGVAGFGWASAALTGDGDPELVSAARLTGNSFDVMGARAAIGRVFRPGDDSTGARPVVVLTHNLWRRRFGADSTIIGKSIEVSGNKREVIGVMPRGFTLPTMEESELFVPLDLAPILRDINRTQKFRFLRVFGRLGPDVSITAAQSDVDRAMQAMASDLPGVFSGIGARVVPIRDALVSDSRSRLLMLMGAAAFVLLIACANIAGVLLSRALARRDELSIRVALGAGRRRLMRQFLAEGTVFALLGGTIGLAIAQLGVVALRAVATSALPAGLEFSLEPTVLLFAMAITIVGGLAFSVVPAFSATRIRAGSFRSSEYRTTSPKASRRVRMSLVVGQLAVAVALLVGAGLFLRSLQRLYAVDLGYHPDHLLTFEVSLPPAKYGTSARQDAFWDMLQMRLAAIPGVTATGSAGNLPLGGGSSSSITFEGRPGESDRAPEVQYAVVSDGYFNAMGIPVVKGRAFSPADRDSAPGVVIVSAGMARKFWPDSDPIGTRVRAGPDPAAPWATVIGVVADVRVGSVGTPQPTIYASQRQDHWGGGAVIMRVSGDPHAFEGAARGALRAVDPLMPMVSLRSVEEYRRATQTVADQRLQMRLMLVFALAALLLSAIGVYGVSAYAVEARRREFGIRMALGATRHRVLLAALSDGAQATAIGLLIGVPLALVLAQTLRTMLYATRPFDVPTLVCVLGVLLLVVLLASLVPARRATRVDPVTAMRD